MPNGTCAKTARCPTRGGGQFLFRHTCPTWRAPSICPGMNTKLHLSGHSLTAIVEGALARFSAPDRIIIRAWADGDTLPQIAEELGLNLRELEERWEHHILPGLRLTVVA